MEPSGVACLPAFADLLKFISERKPERSSSRPKFSPLLISPVTVARQGTVINVSSDVRLVFFTSLVYVTKGHLQGDKYALA